MGTPGPADGTGVWGFAGSGFGVVGLEFQRGPTRRHVLLEAYLHHLTSPGSAGSFCLLLLLFFSFGGRGGGGGGGGGGGRG